MRNKQKWGWAIGVLAMIGVGLWMRELASWRPVLVARVPFDAEHLRISRDGKSLLARSSHGQAAMVDLETRRVKPQSEPIFDFDADRAAIPFPRVWIDETRRHLNFSATRNRSVRLAGLDPATVENFQFRFTQGGSPVAWSSARGEVYSELSGEIYLWNWNTGALKRRVKYSHSNQIDAHVVFSPDARWCLVGVKKPIGMKKPGDDVYLRCYDVQNGKLVASLGQDAWLDWFGFSPDGRFIWFVSSVVDSEFHVTRTADFKSAWNTPCAGAAKWLPDGRIGLVKTDGFEWRDASGRLLRRLSGPSNGPSPTIAQALRETREWVLSPDGNHIYSGEEGGAIRRWRAK